MQARPADRRRGRLLHLHRRENQPRLFDAAGALPWESTAGEAWTVNRGHGRVDVRTIKTLPSTGRIRALFPHVEQVFLVERYS